MGCFAGVQFSRWMVSEYYNCTLKYANLYDDKGLSNRIGEGVMSVSISSRRTLYTSPIMGRTLMKGVNTLGYVLFYSIHLLINDSQYVKGNKTVQIVRNSKVKQANV